VDSKRFIWVLVIFCGGLLLYGWWAMKQPEKARPPQPTQPASQEAPKDRTAASGATTGGATTASAPAAVAEANRPTTQPRPVTAPAPGDSNTATAPASTPTAGPSLATRPTGDELHWYDVTDGTPRMWTIGSLEPDGNFVVQVELNNRGASVNTVKLAKFFATVNDKRLFEKDRAAYEEARRNEPTKYKGHYSLLNPASDGEHEYLPLATRTITVGFPDGNIPSWSWDLSRELWAAADANKPLKWDRALRQWVTEPPDTAPDGSQSVRFYYRLGRGKDAPDARTKPVLQIVKTYTLPRDSYSVMVSLRIENLTDQRMVVSVDQCGPTGVPQEDLYRDCRRGVYAQYDPEKGKTKVWMKAKDEAGKAGIGGRLPLGSNHDANPVLWVGQINKFFGSVLYLIPEPNRTQNPLYPTDPTLTVQYYLSPVQGHGDPVAFLAAANISGLVLDPQSSSADISRRPSVMELNFDLFTGPKKRDMFSDSGADYHRQRYGDLDYIQSIDSGSCFLAPSWLVWGMMWLLEKFAVLSFGNYGVAIILLVLLVRLVLHPLTRKGQVSMHRMQKMAPKIEKLKEKYGDDKATLQKETMKLYKEGGVSQVMGCLPMILQMPIWIALYSALTAAIQLRHAGFLPFWITDLAAPDAVITWARDLPVIGYSLNLLPILLTVAMYFQSMTATPSAQPASREKAQQQKMMKYMMPGMMFFFFYNMPSGLTLYVMTSTFAGLLEQKVIRKHIEEKEAAEAATEVQVDAPGKAARAARSKKPKGPFWFKHG